MVVPDSYICTAYGSTYIQVLASYPPVPWVDPRYLQIFPYVVLEVWMGDRRDALRLHFYCRDD